MADTDRAALQQSADIVATVLGEPPRLRVDNTDPAATVDRVRDLLATTGHFYDRGVPVSIANDTQLGGMAAHAVTPETVVREVHRRARPVEERWVKDALKEVPVRLDRAIGVSYLDMKGEWDLPPLNGITSAPLLRDDGTIHASSGYDPQSGMWVEHVPSLTGLIPDTPSRAEAGAALLRLRHMFRTYAFADASTVPEEGQDVPVVDLQLPPGKDESAFLAGLMTAVSRPSLPVAPALLLRGAEMSGGGTGKGLLARCICAIAFGRAPAALTPGKQADEFDKRIGAALMGGAPAVFFDNINGQSLKSDTLASAITERPSHIRVLGESKMVTLNATAFIVLTGNALDVGEDLVRRFIRCELDAKRENPEARVFKGDLLAEVGERRAELLAACLTIWRWGRQQQAAGALMPGQTLGSFPTWCRWVRDPLLALGCSDPSARVAEAKEADPERQMIADIFAEWNRCHGSAPVTASALNPDVERLLDPQGRGRQFLAKRLQKLAGTRAAGFVLTAQRGSGRWSVTTYALVLAEGASVDQPPPTQGGVDTLDELLALVRDG